MNQEFAAVLVAGLTIFGLAFILSQSSSGGGNLFDMDEPPERMTFTQKSLGKVGSSNADHRTIDFGSFTVGEARGAIKVYSASQEEISDRLFGGEKIWFDYNATQPRNGSVRFEVLGRNGRGSVFVKVNGEKVFSEYLVSTGSPEIEIPSRNLKTGMNRIEIGVNRKNFLGSSKYALEDVEVTVNDRKFHDYEETFQVYQYELEDYVESPLTFQITESVKTSPLEIYVNDNRVYSKPQVRAEENIELTPRNANLHTGSNTIRFETDQAPAKYHIDNAQITMRYLGNTQSQDVNIEFGVNSSGLNYARRDDTTEYVTFNYQNLLPSPREMKIVLNDFNTTFIPENGRNIVNFSAEHLEESNRLSIQSNGTYEMENIKVESIRGE